MPSRSDNDEDYEPKAAVASPSKPAKAAVSRKKKRETRDDLDEEEEEKGTPVVSAPVEKKQKTSKADQDRDDLAIYNGHAELIEHVQGKAGKKGEGETVSLICEMGSGETIRVPLPLKSPLRRKPPKLHCIIHYVFLQLGRDNPRKVIKYVGVSKEKFIRDPHDLPGVWS